MKSPWYEQREGKFDKFSTRLFIEIWKNTTEWKYSLPEKENDTLEILKIDLKSLKRAFKDKFLKRNFSRGDERVCWNNKDGTEDIWKAFTVITLGAIPV